MRLITVPVVGPAVPPIGPASDFEMLSALGSGVRVVHVEHHPDLAAAALRAPQAQPHVRHRYVISPAVQGDNGIVASALCLANAATVFMPGARVDATVAGWISLPFSS